MNGYYFSTKTIETVHEIQLSSDEHFSMISNGLFLLIKKKRIFPSNFTT